MYRTHQVLLLSGVMITVLTASGPASAQSAIYRMPGCRKLCESRIRRTLLDMISRAVFVPGS